MKIYFAFQGKQDLVFRELDVSDSITAMEVLELPDIKKIINISDNEFKIGVNSIELDGKYKALPVNYRMSDGERLEVYRRLYQDPKDRRKEKAKLK